MSSATSAASTTLTRTSAHALSFSSGSGDSSPFGGSSHVDRHGFLMSSHRAGGPVLCSLPAFTTGHTPIEVSPEVYLFTRKIIEDLNFEALEVVVRGRQSKIDPEPEPIPTVLILMPDHPQPELWYRAARRIYDKLQRRSLRLSVELIEGKLFDGVYCFPVEESHFIYSQWKTIAETILQNSNIQEWSGVSCWRYGTNRDRHLNPVTVIVDVRKDSVGPFITATQLIRGILAHFNQSDVDILFMKDENKYFAEGPNLHPDVSNGAIYPGVSIGIHGTQAGSSTLGGLVQLRFRNEERWHTYGLTCFHCVWPPEEKRPRAWLAIEGAKKAFSEWKYGPLKLTHPPSHLARQLLQVDHPSFRDISNSINNRSNAIEESKSDQFLRLEKIKKAIDRGEDEYMPESALKQYNGIAKIIRDLEVARQPFVAMRNNETFLLGYVVAGSGLNRIRRDAAQQGMAMDWALINIVPDRLEPQIHGDRVDGNRPFHHGVMWDFPPPIEFLFDPQLQFIANMAKLYKSGRSTKITSGLYGGLQEVSLVETETEHGVQVVETWEHQIATTAISEAFAEKGDSGAWVYTGQNQVFGMLKSGHERRCTMSISRLVDIFEDIKLLTGAEEVRIAPGPAP